MNEAIHGMNRQRVITFADDLATANQPGGPIKVVVAAGALKVGDVVYWTSAGKVNTTATEANGVAFAGVVIGAPVLTDGKCYLGSDYVTSTGVPAAAADGDLVFIGTIGGSWYCLTAGAVTRGARVGFSSTARKVDDAVTAYTFGVARDTGAGANAVILVDFNGLVVELP